MPCDGNCATCPRSSAARLRCQNSKQANKTETEIKISSLEKQVESLKADCEQVKKDYTAARSYISRYVKK